MAQEHPKYVENIVTVKTHHQLRTITEADFKANAAQVLQDADNGIQTAILAPDGKTIRSVVGLNCTRFFPDPDPDPLDEIAAAIAASKAESK